MHELCRHFIKDYDVKFLEDVARLCPYPINEQTNFYSQLWILVSQFFKEQKADIKMLICDRTIVDSLAYANYSVNHRNMKPEEYSLLQNLTHLLAKTNKYDKIYLTYCNGYVENDGVRSLDRQYKKDIHALIEGFLPMLDLNYVQLPEKSQAKFIIRDVEKELMK